MPAKQTINDKLQGSVAAFVYDADLEVEHSNLDKKVSIRFSLPNRFFRFANLINLPLLH